MIRKKTELGAPKGWYEVRGAWEDPEGGVQGFMEEVQASDEGGAAMSVLRRWPGAEILEVVPSRIHRGKLQVAGGRGPAISGPDQYEVHGFILGRGFVAKFYEAGSQQEALENFKNEFPSGYVFWVGAVREKASMSGGARLSGFYEVFGREPTGGGDVHRTYDARSPEHALEMFTREFPGYEVLRGIGHWKVELKVPTSRVGPGGAPYWDSRVVELDAAGEWEARNIAQEAYPRGVIIDARIVHHSSMDGARRPRLGAPDVFRVIFQTPDGRYSEIVSAMDADEARKMIEIQGFEVIEVRPAPRPSIW